MRGPYSGSLNEGNSSAVLIGPSAGSGSIQVTAQAEGSVQACFGGPAASGKDCADPDEKDWSLVPSWLWYDWRGTGREPPQGLATFGIYKGATPLIFRRELYR